LSDADLAEVRRRRGDSSRLGWALQLCGLRMLGFCPDDMTMTAARAGADDTLSDCGLAEG
jgi:hypothetical protein